ncbi:FG-GAP-like repeat-containing protein [Paenarthrobacter sp. NPDC057981]|uniref:FG-GAP-like repeat-containing protein n=1 Tax=Paenarthrobacter sp. NPDC057981 TaxID=3346297 RepID=UPI0036DB98A0
MNTVTNKIYVSVDGTIVAIDGATNAASVVYSGPGVWRLEVNEATNQIFALGGGPNSILIFDISTNTSTTVPVGSYPSDMVLNSATNKVYVTDVDSDVVYVVDGTSKTSISLPAGLRPYRLALNSETNKVYVSNENSSDGGKSLRVIDGVSNSVTPLPFFELPGALVVNSKTDTLYVASGGHYLSVVDLATNRVSKVEYGAFLDGPTNLAVNETTNRVYAVHPSAGKVSVLRAAVGDMDLIQTGRWPQMAAVNEATNKTYVSNQQSGSVTLIDGADAPPAFSAAEPPGIGTVGSLYNYTFKATGSPASSFAVQAGTLPPGLTLDGKTGNLSGIASKTGTYNVQVSAANGVSPSALTKWLTIVVNPAKNDFTSDGKADTLARDGVGNLWLYAGNTGSQFRPRVQVGAGWNVMTSILAPGDLNGDGRPDVLARDTNGVLWLYPGNGYGEWYPRIQVGSGWNIMTSIVGPGDFNGDGKHDVLARDASGALWLYPGNGSAGWLPRLQVGSGWNVMDKIVGPGDFNGDGTHDVLATDTAGTLWLYPGNGKAGWLPRVQVGTGWNSMTAIVGPGDFNSNFPPDGTADLLARDAQGLLWHYPGDGKGGWMPRFGVGWGWDAMTAVL